MGKIYNEAVKVNLFSLLANKFCQVLTRSAFISVGEGQALFGKGVSLEVFGVCAAKFDLSKVKNETFEIFAEIQNFILENINEFSLKETYCFLTKAITDYERSFTSDTVILFDFLKKYYTKSEDIYQWEFEKLYNEDSNFRKEFEETFPEYAKYYLEVGGKLFDLILELRKQFLEGHLVIDSRMEEIPNIDKLNKIVKKNQMEVLEYVVNEHRPVFVLHDNFDLSYLNKNGQLKFSNYSKDQVSLLFDYLCEKGFFIEYSKSSRASLASLLTGYSKQTLRTNTLAAKVNEKKKKANYSNLDLNYKTSDLVEILELINSIQKDLIEKIKLRELDDKDNFGKN